MTRDRAAAIRFLFAIGWLAIALPSCEGGSSGGDAGHDPAPESATIDYGMPDNGEETGREIPAGTDDGTGELPDPGVDAGKDTAQPGEFGQPCIQNSDCISGYCVEGLQGPMCTMTCVLECPADWLCRASLIGSDVISLCIPLGADLCKPCKVDTQCSGGACIEVGDGNYCGRDCSQIDCPEGYDCLDVPTSGGTARQCVPVSRACDCLRTMEGAARPCARSNDEGTCLGFETCDPDTGWACDAPEPQAETCNGLDDNCNRLVDEAFPEIGGPCFQGVGACRAQGVYACSDDHLGLRCAVEEGQEHVEVCDLLDNDCDGATDEDFRTESGAYATDRACGNCYVDCTAIFTGAAHHATGRCDATGPAPRCGYDCVQGYADADGNPDNGCELELDPLAIYVSTPENGGIDGDTCGAWDSPCATVETGLDRADGTGKVRVLVSEGIYAGIVVLQDGVSVKGGYNAATWQRDPATNITILQGVTPATDTSPHRKAVVAIGITAPTEFSGFTVYGENAYSRRSDGRGGNSYALWLKDCGPGLVVKDNVIYAGRGAPGNSGGNGARGANGQDGVTGATCTDSGEVGACSGVFSAGGSAGGSTCGAAGGRGADSVCADGIVQMPSGEAGSGTSGGLGGAGGWSDTVSSACAVCRSEGKTDFGFDGARGGSGTGGEAGQGCTDDNGRISGSEWLSGTSDPGGDATNGSGGGGGGAGGGVDMDPACGYNDRVGSAGGGGGAGGCGGTGGSAGMSGGASIGIFAIRTTSTAGLYPTLSGNRVLRNEGGAGGQGGSGGTGGVGGSGGEGGSVDCAQNSAGSPYWFKVCIGKGGTGGDGGQGGAGGGGGGGCGGASWGILGAGLSGDVPAWCGAAGNVFDALGDGGPGGAGGNSADQPGNAGRAGEASDCTTL